MARKKGSTDYSIETKLEAIRLIYEGGLTQAEVIEELGIRDPKRVKNWLWQYRREGVTGLKKPRRGRPSKKENKAAYIRQLEMENELLKNIIPNCEQICSRSAISGHLSASRRIRSESDVQIFQPFASRILRVGQTIG
jgi:transposase